MAKIFDENFDTSTDGEFFWHATTLNHVLSMIKFDAGGLKPVGTGQLGAGFYLTGARSDYQKAMARRGREGDEPLFLFYVRIKGFYQLKPTFLTAWDTTSEPDSHFSAVCWYKEGSGSVGAAERGGYIPSATTKGKRDDFKYGEYQQTRMFGTAIADKPRGEQLDFMKTLWALADKDVRPAHKDIERFGPIAQMLPFLGARKVFTRILLELAVKDQQALANSAIVGVKVFSPTTEPVKLRFEYARKPYDLRGAVVEEKELRTDDNPLNFHDEVWLDLGEMLRTLSS